MSNVDTVNLINIFSLDLSASKATVPAPISDEELEAQGLTHPSIKQLHWIKASIRSLAIIPSGLTIFAYCTGFTAAYVLGSLLFLNALQYIGTVYIERVNWNRNRPDLFLGWSFDAKADDGLLPIAPLLYELLACLRPAFGAVMLPSPPDTALGKQQEAQGNRLVYLPAVTVRDPERWKSAVSWLLTRVRAAVFDLTGKPGANVQWEIDEAVRILGADAVLLVKWDEAGKVSAWIDGRRLPMPKELDELEPVHPSERLDAIAQILAWCASHLPLCAEEYVAAQRWNRIWHLETVWSYWWIRLFGVAMLFSAGWLVFQIFLDF